jgi:hypothetical protein
MIRLNFDTFNVAPPSTQEPGDAPANGRTQCQKAQFSASGGGTSPTICGSNTGQHMLIEPSDTCNTLTFSWTSTSPRAWDIHIIQAGKKHQLKSAMKFSQSFRLAVMTATNHQKAAHSFTQVS